MNKDQTIFIIDDEPDVREGLSMLMRSVGLSAELFKSPHDYLETYDPDRPGCLLLDMRMPSMSGLELQEKLSQIGLHPPIIMISGHGEVPHAVQAIQAGAIDFLQKPIDDQLLLEKISSALRIDGENRIIFSECCELENRYRTLTPREREVMRAAITGRLNKLIADDLNISTRTVEIHRANVMKKMQAQSFSMLLNMARRIKDCKESSSQTFTTSLERSRDSA